MANLILNSLSDYAGTIAANVIPFLSKRRLKDEKVFRADAICNCRNTLAGKIDSL